MKKDDIIRYLKDKSEMDPDKHDGSYELVRFTVECLSNIPENKIDVVDLDMLYCMTIGAWKSSSEHKERLIKESNLLPDDKKRMSNLLHRIEKDSKEGVNIYQNNPENDNFGMFGTGFLSFKGKGMSKKADTKIFISLCKEIQNEQDENKIFQIAENVFKNDINGLAAASASQILHCLKPNIFPILNKRGMQVYVEEFNLPLEDPKSLVTYISNVRKIRDFRNNNFTYKNYRIIDIGSWEMDKNRDDSDVIIIWNKYKAKILRELGDSHDWSKSLEKMYTSYDNLSDNDIDNLPDDAINELWFSNNHISHISYFLEKKKTPTSFYREMTKLLSDKSKTIGEAFDDCLYAFKNDIRYEGKQVTGQIAQIVRTLFTLRNINFSVVDIARMNDLLILFKKNAIDKLDYKQTLTDGIEKLSEISDEIASYEKIDDYNKRKILWKLWQEALGSMTILNSDKKTSFNTILYGPPGTGKTYSTIEKSIKIANPSFVFPDSGDSKLDREAVKEEFRRLMDEGQIVFSTFHQNLSYEDFIEGLKPIEPFKETDPVIYKVESGIFRRLCVDASFHIANLRKTSETEELLDFSMAYDHYIEKLEESLSNNVKVALKTKTGGEVYIDSISQLGNLVIKHTEGTRTYTVSKDRLSKLHKEIKNLDDLTNINDQFRAVIGGSNTTVYWAVLNELRKEIPQIESKKEKRTYSWEEKKEVVRFLNNDDYRIKDAQQYVLIIDEINRGNVSQIFGELITLIENDKRAGNPEALEVILPYSKDRFMVPPNLHIIGTMNTADRSVEALDTALRRRFSFELMLPKTELVPDEINGLELRKVFEQINERISYLLDEDHQIGHSYFMEIDDENDLKEVFRNRILPLLKEYFYNDYGKIRLILGNDFVEIVEDINKPKFAVSDIDIIDREQYKILSIDCIDIVQALKNCLK